VNLNNLDGVESPDRLTESQIAAIRALVAHWPHSDVSPPLSDQALVGLHGAAPLVRHVVSGGREPLGYAQLTASASGLGAEIVAGTADRDAQLALVLSASIEYAAGRPLTVWAHGADSPVHAVARAHGFTPTRGLLQMRLALASSQPEPAGGLPRGVLIRSFEPGRDEQGWLAVNRRAFAHHPEQGGWTFEDLRGRMEADWFDPAGFLLAEQDGQLLGFHWTKRHDPRTGEVYVLGIDPGAQGRGLGRLLLDAGLEHMRSAGVETVVLYVDESNPAAIALYVKTGFTKFTIDTQYIR
jgi:mycothiol synthase